MGKDREKEPKIRFFGRIRQSLRHARADHVFICGVDMPFVKKEMIRFLAEFISSAASPHGIVVELLSK